MGFFDRFKKKSSQPEWLSQMPEQMAGLIFNQIQSNPQACAHDEIPQGFGKFGLESTNPVPVYGVPSNELYLRRLALKNGDKISWKRVGSLSSSNISMSIDKYDIQNARGETICDIFLSPYHFKTSEKCPEGFKFK